MPLMFPHTDFKARSWHSLQSDFKTLQEDPLHFGTRAYLLCYNRSFGPQIDFV